MIKLTVVFSITGVVIPTKKGFLFMSTSVGILELASAKLSFTITGDT